MINQTAYWAQVDGPAYRCIGIFQSKTLLDVYEREALLGKNLCLLKVRLIELH